MAILHIGIILIGTLLALSVVYITSFRGELPPEAIIKVMEIDKQSITKEQLIKNIYIFVNQSYKSPIRQYLKEPNKIFIKDINKIWQHQGEYMPSNAQNEIAKQMLIATNRFKESDFTEKQLFCEISPHNALFVKANDKEYVLDLWFADNNGEFNCYTQNPCGIKKICLS